MGKEMGEAVIDERGRIVIPNALRSELNLRPDQRLRVSARGDEIVLSPEAGLDDFVAGLKGCVKGSKVSPRELKEMWGVGHPHR